MFILDLYFQWSVFFTNHKSITKNTTSQKIYCEKSYSEYYWKKWVEESESEGAII